MLKAMGHLPTVEAKDLATAMVTPSPESEAAVKDRGCFTPDFPDEEIAKSTDPGKLADCLQCADEDGFDEADGEELARHLITSHQRMLARSSGSGSFPAGCDPDWPDRHVATVYFDKNTFPNGFFHENVTSGDLDGLVEAKVWGTREKVMDLYSGRTILDVAWDLFVLTYIRVGILHKQVSDAASANIVIRGKRIPGNVVGYAYFNNGSCDDQVDHFLDTGYRPGLLTFTQLLSHEGGHNNNLDHEFRREHIHHGIMSYNDPDLYWGFSTGEGLYQLPRDPSHDDLARYYGTEPFPVNEPVEPGPDPQPPVGANAPKVRVEINGQWVDYVPKGTVPNPDQPNWGDV